MEEENVVKEEKEVDTISFLPADEQPIVRELKTKGIDVNVVNISGKNYYFRTFNRLEYQKLMADTVERAQAEGAQQHILVMASEEALVLLCSLHPKIGRENIKGYPAGVISTLYEMIMLQSGFNQPEVFPVKL